MPELRIGTSGWNYGHWRGIFYPQGLKQSAWLEFYSRTFDSVEINVTFYRLPKPEYVTNWDRAVPEDFLFSVKGSRYLTHIKRLGETGEPLDRFFDIMDLLGEKAGPILWQLPPAMKRNNDRLAAFAGALPSGRRHVFEFRHESWYCQEVYDILDNAGAALCVPVRPEIKSDIVQTAPWMYFRFHCGEEGGLFTTREIKKWAVALRQFKDAGADIYAYFNNDWQGFALRNAQELRKALR